MATATNNVDEQQNNNIVATAVKYLALTPQWTFMPYLKQLPLAIGEEKPDDPLDHDAVMMKGHYNALVVVSDNLCIATDALQLAILVRVSGNIFAPLW